MVIEQEEPDEFTSTAGTAAYKLYHFIPESEKVDDYDYDKLIYEALKEKYGIE